MTRINNYPIDIVISEEWSREVTLTKYAMETGVTMTDHAHLEPDTLTIEGVISDTPLDAIASFRESTDGITPSKQAEISFNATLTARQPIEVLTASRLYKSMIMVGFTNHDDKDTNGGFWFTCKFQQALIIDTDRTIVSVTRKQGGGHKLPKDYFHGQVVIWRWGHGRPGNPHTVADPVESISFRTKKGEVGWWYNLTPRNRLGYVSKNGSRPQDKDFLKLNDTEVDAFHADQARDLQDMVNGPGGTEEHSRNIDNAQRTMNFWQTPDNMPKNTVPAGLGNSMTGKPSLLEVGQSGQPLITPNGNIPGIR